MNELFRQKIRHGKITPPTAGNVDVERWQREWKRGYESGNVADPSAEMLFNAGNLFRTLFDEISTALVELMDKRPAMTDDTIVRALFAMSNRNRAVLSATALQTMSEGGQLLAYSVNNTGLGNEMSLAEVADGGVDIISKACFFILRGNHTKASKPKLLDQFTFVRTLLHLSQIYENYESYWHALVWSDYHYSSPSAAEPYHQIQQQLSMSEMALMVSETRRQKLQTQEGLMLCQVLANRPLPESHYLVPSKSGRQRTVKTCALSSASDYIQNTNLEMLGSIELLAEQFPREFMEIAVAPCVFTVTQALSVFRLLSVYSIELQQRYPENDACFVMNTLWPFAPSVNRISLAKALSSVLNLPHGTIEDILCFLTYDGTHGRDLWCFPLMRFRENQLCLLSSALLSPNLVRVAEHWFRALGIDLTPKGDVYEKRLLNWANMALKNNPIITDYDEASSGRFRYSTEEEIDLLLRIGTTILVVEAKSIVTTDSPISGLRSVEILKHAGEQASRKAKFVEANAQSIAGRLGWPFQAETIWQVEPVIAVSNRDLVGFKVNGVPVVDDHILRHYLAESTVPLLSKSSTNGFEHMVYFQLYENQQEAEERLSIYLTNPPQILSSESDYDLCPMRFPQIHPNSEKVHVSRWLYRGKDIRAIISGSHPFKIIKTVNWEHELDEGNVLI